MTTSHLIGAVTPHTVMASCGGEALPGNGPQLILQFGLYHPQARHGATEAAAAAAVALTSACTASVCECTQAAAASSDEQRPRNMPTAVHRFLASHATQSHVRQHSAAWLELPISCMAIDTVAQHTGQHTAP
jgi:hypothetical protein